MSDSDVSNNQYGFYVHSFGSGIAKLAVAHSAAVDNSAGIYADQTNGTVYVAIGNSMVTGNLNGIVNAASATIESMGNNMVRMNGQDVSGAVTTFGGT